MWDEVSLFPQIRKNMNKKPSDKEILYPIIEEIINDLYAETGDYVSRDTIATKLLTNVDAHQVIAASVDYANRSDRALWDKSANYVDWLNADITDEKLISKKWNRNFYDRDKRKAKHPFTGSIREIYFLRPQFDNFSDDNSIVEELMDLFAGKTVTKTHREQLILARLGQGNFRKELLRYWKQRCSVTGCNDGKVLRASHIKPWSVSNDKEKLDPFNGLLLIPNLDIAFDKGIISFDENGFIKISPFLSNENRLLLGINTNMHINVTEKHQFYMEYHRRHCYLG